MATEVKVPSMGESITSGSLSMACKDGDFVEKDQPIYELETDKITSKPQPKFQVLFNLRSSRMPKSISVLRLPR